MYGNRFRRFSPVKEGDEIDVKIEAIGEKGDGIAKKDGFVLIVPNTSQGDEVRVRITKVLRRVGFAEVVGKGEPTPEQEEEPGEIEDAEEPQEEEPEEIEDADSEEPEEAEEENPETEEQAEDSEDFGSDLDE
ncbi:TRAM domain-containing protein [Candidatus Woesearchaeota archaeon]|nr:TRAM domain-containing protein [Candidatus Woesearchaeota archaeon]